MTTDLWIPVTGEDSLTRQVTVSVSMLLVEEPGVEKDKEDER